VTQPSFPIYLQKCT